MADWKAPGIATVSPFVMTDKPQAVIDFAVGAVGATLPEPPLYHADGSFWHASLSIDDGTVMVSGVADPSVARPAFIHVYVPDCDATYAAALDAGATAMMPPADMFYGERAGGVFDPAGNVWWFATVTEILDRDELERRAAAADAARAG